VNDDRALAVSFAAHDEGALEEAYRRYGTILVAAARSVLGSGSDARDCVHDSLVRVWAKESAYRIERGSLRAFLIVCVRNEAITRRRSATRALARERHVMSNVIDVADHVDVAERLTLQNALSVLPRDQRDVIELAYWGDLTQPEIASRLGVPLGTIKSRASLGLRKLARALGKGAAE
jgi:RNA polymerase sigma-70 factor (ECF subfamily)